MDDTLQGLAFEHLPEPASLVVGETIESGNRAWRAAVGEARRLSDCFVPEDAEALGRALIEARGGPVELVARLATGDRAGAPQRFSLWPVGETAVGLRFCGPAEDPLASPGDAITWMFEQAGGVVWAIRKDGTIVMSHGAGLARYGLAPGQLLGVDALQLYPEESDAFELTHRVLSGETVHELVHDEMGLLNRFCVPLRDERGEVTTMLGISLPVSGDVERVQNAERLLDIVNDLPLIVFAMKKDGTCTLSVGKQLEKMGFRPGQLVGTNLFEFYASMPKYIEQFHRVLAGEVLNTEELIAGRIFSAHYEPERDLFGEIVGLYAVVQDITEERDAQQALLEQRGRIASQERTIAEIVSPIIEVWQGVLVVPLIGGLGEERAAVLTEKLLSGVVERGARFAILDLTGVDTVDTATAHHLFQVMRCVELLGCTCMVSGIRASVAQTMVELGLAMTAKTFPTLAGALRSSMQALRG